MPPGRILIHHMSISSLLVSPFNTESPKLSQESSGVPFVLSIVQVIKFSLFIILDQAGYCDLRGLTHFPALEIIQPFLACLKQGSFQLIQPGHQCRSVFVVGILGRVHDATESTNKCLKMERANLNGRKPWWAWVQVAGTSGSQQKARLCLSVAAHRRDS